jgi:hypothetical protein
MTTSDLFKGIAVIIDNQIDDKESEISKIKDNIEQNNIPVLTFTKIPKLDIISSFSSVSFIILDWDYFNNISDTEERISIPDELKKSTEEELLRFITEIQQSIFVPIFIFTALDTTEIVATLNKHGLLNKRIFIKQKTEISSAKELFDSIEDWLKETPSIYVLKEWEQTIIKAKERLFLEMFKYSPYWANIIWKMIKNDSLENSFEFGEFITRNLVNRIDKYSFDENLLQGDAKVSPDELSHVVEGERYLQYTEQPVQAYTGDLFLQEEDYYLNIRAQCDLSRKNMEGKYDPVLYCIKGQKLKKSDITIEDIKINPEEELAFSENDHIKIEDLLKICHVPEELKKVNHRFIKHRNSIFFRKGEFLEKKLEIILTCIADSKIIQFQTDIEPINFTTLKAFRIGRVLPPYITRIQQKCAQNIIREGTMPIPVELFTTYDE